MTLVRILSCIITILALLGVLPLDTSGTAASEGRLEGKVDVLLRVETDDEGGDVDNLREHWVIFLLTSACHGE